MTRLATLLIGSALTSLIASQAFAADAAPAAAPAAPPVAAAAVAPKEDPAAAVKIGYLDMARVAAESAEGKAATETLKKKSEQLRGKMDSRQKQLEKQKAAIEAKLSTMTPKERSTKGAEFQKKVEEYQKFVRNSELEMSQLQDKLTNEVGGVIKKAAAEYAKANGYILVAEEKGVLFLDERVKPKDLTEEVVAHLAKQKK